MKAKLKYKTFQQLDETWFPDDIYDGCCYEPIVSVLYYPVMGFSRDFYQCINRLVNMQGYITFERFRNGNTLKEVKFYFKHEFRSGMDLPDVSGNETRNWGNADWEKYMAKSDIMRNIYKWQAIVEKRRKTHELYLRDGKVFGVSDDFQPFIALQLLDGDGADDTDGNISYCNVGYNMAPVDIRSSIQTIGIVGQPTDTIVWKYSITFHDVIGLGI